MKAASSRKGSAGSGLPSSLAEATPSGNAFASTSMVSMYKFSDREVLMKVIGAGFGRTGTLSLKMALEQLGHGPAMHLMDLALQPAALNHWQEAADGKKVDWNQVLTGWEATVDWPAT